MSKRFVLVTLACVLLAGAAIVLVSCGGSSSAPVKTGNVTLKVASS